MGSAINRRNVVGERSDSVGSTAIGRFQNDFVTVKKLDFKEVYFQFYKFFDILKFGETLLLIIRR